MIKAKYQELLPEKKVKCTLCPNFCIIDKGKTGICRVRKNISGELFSLNYARPSAIALDPIEKKPLYHFFPGTKILSIGSYGCNLSCKNCQNYEISQISVPEGGKEYMPKKIIELAIKSGSTGIAYTYNEPTVFFEYILEIAKLAKKQGLKNVLVSNGYINPDPLKELIPYLNAANIDLKTTDDKILKSLAGARTDPIIKTIKLLKQKNIWTEITRLIIPKITDDKKEFERSCKLIKEKFGTETPLHITRFYPMYKLQDKEITKNQTLKEMKKIAEKYLDYTYIGNTENESNTYCKNCGALLIKRQGYKIEKMLTEKGECQKCSAKLPGIFK